MTVTPGEDNELTLVLEDAIARERSTWVEKGYTAEHDRTHGGRQHLLNQAMIYATNRRYAAACALLIQAGITPPIYAPIEEMVGPFSEGNPEPSDVS